MKKRLFSIFTTIILIVGILTGCSKDTVTKSKNIKESKESTIKIGASLVPHSEILEFVKPKLKKKGINIEIVTIDDDGQLNQALEEKQIDANFFQHVPYLESISKERGYDFSVVGNIHIEPIGFYSKSIKTIEEIKKGSKIAIPDNPSNEYRALVLLESNGLIKLRPGIEDYSATPKDIVENPKNLEFVEVDSGQLTRVLQDVEGAVINTNRVLEANIDPETAIFREDATSPYSNVVVVRKEDENKEEIKKLVESLTSDDIKDFIKEKYGSAVIPAF
ncbi:putative D-methionine-binding lipoprotein MetQ [Gottschalkia purinilytica]|uniref:Lipoprotein n=1 Tax=Gottschalkia purinilytica TaxID=1503 RepID=A0A0L0WB31_GOTPU|nr:MetQ/NlpA family ABC transporter substrate-binding protein [Gottschalkia purinilytica]KNF08652.1 putative D-methionine-binding lipoprotein MetQ [Gottschalkia purinilytica]